MAQVSAFHAFQPMPGNQIAKFFKYEWGVIFSENKTGFGAVSADRPGPKQGAARLRFPGSGLGKDQSECVVIGEEMQRFEDAGFKKPEKMNGGKQMKATNRRRWSILVALAMVLMMLPTTAMAAPMAHNVLVSQPTNGTVAVWVAGESNAGVFPRPVLETQELVIFPEAADGYEVGSVKIRVGGTSPKEIDITSTLAPDAGGNDSYHWTLPDDNSLQENGNDKTVTVIVDFVKKMYPVAVHPNAVQKNEPKLKHGTTTVSPSKASVGDTITVTANPDSGYKATSIWWAWDNDSTNHWEEIKADLVGNQYTFKYPVGATGIKVVVYYEPATDLGITVDSPIQNGKVVLVSDVTGYSVTSGGLKATATTGAGIYVDITPANGYILEKLTVKEYVSGIIIPTEKSTGALSGSIRYGFEMPGKDVFVTATFVREGSGTTYEVKVNPSTNGNVTADPSPAAAGAKVALIVTPDEGYTLDKMTVAKTDGTAITVSNNTFTMPAENVVVTATFKVDTSKDGWNSDSTGVYYLENNQRLKGFQTLDGYKRYFDPSTGYMATGFKVINNNWYAFNEYGGMLYGWQVINGSVYYLGEKDGEYPGAVRFGVTQVDGFWRYFDNEGKLVYGGTYFVPPLGQSYSINQYGALEYPVR